MAVLRIPVDSVDEQGIELNERLDPAALAVFIPDGGKGDITFARPIDLHVRVKRSGESITIDGRIDFQGRIQCSRCLDASLHTLSTTFRTTAVAQAPVVESANQADGVELSADEMNVLVYHGDSLDLRDEVAQQIILALPIKPICRSTCRGLCSRCGINLNRETCVCASADDHNPFAALSHLSFPDPKK